MAGQKQNKAAKTPTDPAGRLKVLQWWWARRKNCRRFDFDGALERYREWLLERGIAVSRATLFGWDQRYLEGGLEGLCDGRGRGQRRTPTDPFLALVARMHFGRPSVALCYSLAKTRAGEFGAIPSYKACTRYVAALQAERRKTVRMR